MSHTLLKGYFEVHWDDSEDRGMCNKDGLAKFDAEILQGGRRQPNPACFPGPLHAFCGMHSPHCTYM